MEQSVENINKTAALKSQCSTKDTLILNSCDASINFADAAFDSVQTPAHPDIAITLIGASEASYTMGEFLKDAGTLGYQWADNSRRILQGEVIGTGKAVADVVKGTYQLLAHPQETIAKLDLALYKMDRFLGKLLGGDPTTIQETKKLCQAFMNLPLENKSEFVTEFLMSFYIPGKVGSMVTSLFEHPSVARGLTSLGKMAAEELPLLEVALNTQLRFGVESTELVTFGGRVMSTQLRDQLVKWSKVSETVISDVELVERAEALVPLTRACTRAAQEFVKAKSDLQIADGTNSTIWTKIKPTQDYYPNTKIPKSFELHLENGKFWVHPNATEHMAEFFKYRATHGMPVGCQLVLTDFANAVTKAVNNGVKYQSKVVIGSWEFVFGKPRAEGLLPVIKHALYKM